VYPKEIKACLKVRFENPPAVFWTLLEHVRSYKVTHDVED